MVSARLRATDYALWTAAVAWPFGVFLQTPVAGVGLLTIVALALVFLLVPDALAERKLSVPFEIWLPALLIAIFTAARTWSDPKPEHRDILEGLLLLVLVIQANPVRESIHRFVFAGAMSSGVAALLSLSAAWLGLLPTAFTFRSDVDFTFAYSLAEGAHVLFIGIVFAVHMLISRDAAKWQRMTSLVALLIMTVLLFERGREWVRDTGALPALRYPQLEWFEWVPALLTLWLATRVLAKVEVDRRIAADPLHRVWWMAAGVSILVAALAPIPPRPYLGFLLGLACATTLPARGRIRLLRWPVLEIVAVLALVGVNLFVVFPANVYDPRQYDAAAQREMPHVFDGMDWIDRHARNERRTYLWRARGALEYGLPNFSSFAFERATRPLTGSTILAQPTEAERQQFLVLMRDTVAALPEDRAVSAYERVLLANGERDAALYSLRLRTGVPLIHVEDADAAPYTRVVGLVVGDWSIADDLRTWTADEVLTLLSLWGTDVTFAATPEEAPEGLFILAAQRTWDTFTVHVRVGERVTEFTEPLAPVTQRDVESLTQTSVMVWAGPGADAAGNMRYTLNVLTSEGLRPAAYVDVYADGAARFAWAANPPVIAFIPAVRVRIGK